MRIEGSSRSELGRPALAFQFMFSNVRWGGQTFDIASLTVGDLMRPFLKRFSISSSFVCPEHRHAMLCVDARLAERTRLRRECSLTVFETRVQ